MSQRPKILLVDDSRTTLMMEKMILTKGAYDVVTATNGDEGIARAIEEQPDLILLDVVMPGLDGFEVCRRLRANAATQHTPIIMVSTRGEEENVREGFEVGCSDYVTKPIDSIELLDKVRDWLEAPLEAAAAR